MKNLGAFAFAINVWYDTIQSLQSHYGFSNVKHISSVIVQESILFFFKKQIKDIFQINKTQL